MVRVTKNSVQEIDAMKRALEFKSIVDLKRIFSNMARDASAIYKATGQVRAEEISINSKLEFTKEIRDIMRKTIKIFGFQIRSALESKFDLLFDVETKMMEIEIDFKRIQNLEGGDEADAKLEAINKDFLLASSLFVANESESQSEFITKTNKKEIEASFVAAGVLYVNELNSLRARKQELESRLLAGDNSVRNELQSNTRKIITMQNSQRDIIATTAQRDFKQKAIARSELIAEQNVGMTESWARQKEAELINDAALVTTAEKVIRLEKSWNAILDSRTRETHAEADGQTVGINDSFLVGGEQLKYPRDPSGSAANTMRCRCVAEHSVI